MTKKDIAVASAAKIAAGEDRPCAIAADIQFVVNSLIDIQASGMGSV